MTYEEMIKGIEAVESGEDAKDQILDILNKWENPDTQTIQDLNEQLKTKNEELERRDIRIEELRKFNAEQFFNQNSSPSPKDEPEVEETSIEDIIDTF